MTLFRDRSSPPPDGIVLGNGRLEARQIDIAPEHPGRVLGIPVREGDLVPAGGKLALIDTDELEAQLDGAEAEAPFAREAVKEAVAIILQRESNLELAGHDLDRALSLVEQGHIPQATMEARRTARNVALAALSAAKAHVATAERQVVAMEAEVRRVKQRRQRDPYGTDGRARSVPAGRPGRDRRLGAARPDASRPRRGLHGALPPGD